MRIIRDLLHEFQSYSKEAHFSRNTMEILISVQA